MASPHADARRARALAIRDAGGLEAALASGVLPERVDTTLSEALVLGLLRQGVTAYVGIFGHGSTELGEVLRVYQDAGVVRMYPVRNEVAAAHAAMALRWVTGEKAAVVTSIGPGALQAMAGSLAAASDGIGVWHLYGDETSEDEGPNMQQVPKEEQARFLALASTMGAGYSLHTPGALATALRRGAVTVDHPYRAGPFYLLLPMNTQPAVLRGLNLRELPPALSVAMGPAADGPHLDEAVRMLREAERVVVKLGYGARGAPDTITRLLDLVDGVAVTTPIATGVVPYDHPRCMGVGGSKGSISGNFAMDDADLVLAIGTRFVCQSDSSRTGYPKATGAVIIDADPHKVAHYNGAIPLLGDVGQTVEKLVAALEAAGAEPPPGMSPWLEACTEAKARWYAFKEARYAAPTLFDQVWQAEVLTQPAAIKVATDWCREVGAKAFFDAGDVQANGFQVVEDEHVGQTFTETGASYMGFAVSALMASAMARAPFYGVAFTGDGSFTMNPQILIDGVEHGAKGCILLMDNRRMAAISSLQDAQYGEIYATNDAVQVDYLAWARAVRGVRAIDGGRTPESLRRALEEAHDHDGLSLVYVPVYFGPDPLGGLGAFGRWNVGSWVPDVQRLRHDIGL